MQYIEYIEESKTWTCPKTGKWKVICVGGGGCYYNTQGKADGSSTSFGTYLIASGGVSLLKATTKITLFFGYAGVNSNSYGQPIEISAANEALSTTDIHKLLKSNCFGYGASYGDSGTATNGQVKTTIIDIPKDEKIACTIGKGGIISGHETWGSLGGDGVIIVQYLGE